MSDAKPKRAPIQKRHTQVIAEQAGVPMSVAVPTLVCYRSFGIGVFGVFMRWLGMPLEKIALFMNSSQVSGKNQFAQAVRLTFEKGVFSPYKVVGPASLYAWLFQYSVMGFAFQTFDTALSRALGVEPVWYGEELMKPVDEASRAKPPSFVATSVAKTMVIPVLAGGLESFAANRAEVQRYYGPDKFVQIERKLNWNALMRQLAPGYTANLARNAIMSTTTFVLTPVTYKLYFPQERKSKSSLFWYGLTMNIFVGNVIAITQQALWGRALDYGARNGGQPINYAAVVREGLQREGVAAFFTPGKWFARVLMNAPAQGTLPWFYNQVLPLGETSVLSLVKKFYNGASPR